MGQDDIKLLKKLKKKIYFFSTIFVGLVWQGGNGWDDMVREQLEESTLKQRLGGRRDSAAQIDASSPPPDISPPPLSKIIMIISIMLKHFFME